MSELGFTLIGVGHGDSDGGIVGSWVRSSLEGRAIVYCVLGRGRDETTRIVSSIHLIVRDIEENWEERSVHARHVIVGWFHSDVTKSVGGLFEHR